MQYSHRQVTQREKVFILSLMYHGFRRIQRHRTLTKFIKKRIGYVAPATQAEDASGVDLWVKMPGHNLFLPVQVTQRGVQMYRWYKNPTDGEIDNFLSQSDQRLREKRERSKLNNIVFVLLGDFVGKTTTPQIAWRDVQAMRFAVQNFVTSTNV